MANKKLIEKAKAMMLQSDEGFEFSYAAFLMNNPDLHISELAKVYRLKKGESCAIGIGGGITELKRIK